jgi:hypothetical protein
MAGEASAAEGAKSQTRARRRLVMPGDTSNGRTSGRSAQPGDPPSSTRIGSGGRWGELPARPRMPRSVIRYGPRMERRSPTPATRPVYTAPEGNAKRVCDATLSATDLVIVTPVNWYSVSWPTKLYLDHWSAWMRIPELAFAATLAGSGSGRSWSTPTTRPAAAPIR